MSRKPLRAPLFIKFNAPPLLEAGLGEILNTLVVTFASASVLRNDPCKGSDLAARLALDANNPAAGYDYI
jgi:hypothetical protein